MLDTVTHIVHRGFFAAPLALAALTGYGGSCSVGGTPLGGGTSISVGRSAR